MSTSGFAATIAVHWVATLCPSLASLLKLFDRATFSYHTRKALLFTDEHQPIYVRRAGPPVT